MFKLFRKFAPYITHVTNWGVSGSGWQGSYVLFDSQQNANAGYYAAMNPDRFILGHSYLDEFFKGEYEKLHKGYGVDLGDLGVYYVKPGLKVTPDKNIVAKGDYFNLVTEFDEDVTVPSNAAIITYNYDNTKFAYRGFTPAEGLNVLRTQSKEGSITIVISNLQDYAISKIGKALFSTLKDAALKYETVPIDVNIEYVFKDSDGSKSIVKADTVAGVVTTYIGDEVTLIDLSNVIDLFGV